MTQGDIPLIREEDEDSETSSVRPTTRRTTASKLSINPSASQDLLSTGIEESNQCLKMLAFSRSLVGDSPNRKTDKQLDESYKVLGDCMDKLSLALAKLTKGNAIAGVLAREKDNQTHGVASLRLEVDRLTDYANEVTAENNELMGRLGLFEDEIVSLQQKARQATEAKEEACDRVDQLQISLNQKSKECEHLVRERADMMTQLKMMTDKVKVLEELEECLKEELTRGGGNLSEGGLDRQNYLNQISEKQHTIEYLELKANEHEEEIQNLKLDLQTEKEFNANLKKEMKDVKVKLEELEQAKRGYLNGLGTSKLGISTLGFSKIFQHAGTGGGAIIPSALNSSRITSEDRESIVKVAKKTDQAGESSIFDIQPSEPIKSQASAREPTTKPLDFFTPSELRQLPPPLALKGLSQPADKYVARLTGSILQDTSFRDSRVSRLLQTIGGMGKNKDFELKQDYLGMMNLEYVLSDLRRMGDDTPAQQCYSDNVFLFDGNFKKNRMIVVLTTEAISFFHPQKKVLLKLYQLKSLQGVTISASNYTMAVLHFANQTDLLLESFRRLEMIGYISHCRKRKMIPALQLTVCKRFLIKDPKQSVPAQIEVSDPSLKIGLSFLQQAIRNSKKSGFLVIKGKHWYGGTKLSEYFWLLSNIGMIAFKKYGEKKPQAYQPILGADVKLIADPDASGAGKGLCAFEIRYGSEASIMVAATNIEAETWVKAIRDVQKKAKNPEDAPNEVQGALQGNGINPSNQGSVLDTKRDRK